MAKLPYKTNPKPPKTTTIGNESIGEIEFPTYGTILPQEKRIIDDIMGDAPDIFTETAKVANEIAAKSNLSIQEIYEALNNRNFSVLGGYMQDLIDFQLKMDSVMRRRQFAIATALIKCRIDQEWTIEDTENTNQIPPELVLKIAEFADEEEGRFTQTQQELVALKSQFLIIPMRD